MALIFVDDPSFVRGQAHATWNKDRAAEETMRRYPDWYERKIISRVSIKESGCQIWTGYKSEYGYGVTDLPTTVAKHTSGSVSIRVHRVKWLAEKGPIALGWVPDHLCRNTSCLRLDHLEVVTQEENVRRGSTKKYCYSGHEIHDETNRYKSAGRKRGCRECTLAKGRIMALLLASAHRKAGCTQREFVNRYGRSFDTLIRHAGGNEEAKSLIVGSASLDDIRIVATHSGRMGVWCKSLHIDSTSDRPLLYTESNDNEGEMKC